MGSIIINSLFVTFCIIHPLFLMSLSVVESYYVPSSPAAISRIRTTITARIKSRTPILQQQRHVVNFKSRVNEDEIEIMSNDDRLVDDDVDVKLSSSSSGDTTTARTFSTTTTSTTPTSTRRTALSTMTTSAAAAALFFPSFSSPAVAGVAEIDKSTGSLYTPKKQMLAGGSEAARGGIPVRNTFDGSPGEKLKSGEQIQTVYETRFIAYLSRFLINFDDAANSFWKTSITSSSSDNSLSLIHI